MNKVFLLGHITRDPETGSTNSGLSVTKFNLAVNRPKKEDGTQQADFINCIAWRKQAENIAKYCKKGSQIALEGRISTGSYEAQDGTKRYTTDIIVDNVTFLNHKNENNQESEESNPFEDFANEIELSDDTLPF